MTHRIERGLSLRKFARDVATSPAGLAGQVKRLYHESLNRVPSALELRATLDVSPVRHFKIGPSRTS